VTVEGVETFYREAGPPDDFAYTFDAHAAFLQSFVEAMGLSRYVIWLHDYGSQFALSAPERVAGLVIQNGDIYADAFGPKFDFLKKIWNNPVPTRGGASPSTSPSKASAASSSASYRMTSPTGSVPTCRRCTGR
jgi:pimeloyl-ACP methyl ester carboxylesterase